MFSFGYSGEKLTMKIREKTFEAMLSQEMGWYDKTENGVGSLCAQLSGDAASVQGVQYNTFSLNWCIQRWRCILKNNILNSLRHDLGNHWMLIYSEPIISLSIDLM